MSWKFPIWVLTIIIACLSKYIFLEVASVWSFIFINDFKLFQEKSMTILCCQSMNFEFRKANCKLCHFWTDLNPAKPTSQAIAALCIIFEQRLSSRIDNIKGQSGSIETTDLTLNALLGMTKGSSSPSTPWLGSLKFGSWMIWACFWTSLTKQEVRLTSRARAHECLMGLGSRAHQLVKM